MVTKPAISRKISAPSNTGSPFFRTHLHPLGANPSVDCVGVDVCGRPLHCAGLCGLHASIPGSRCALCTCHVTTEGSDEYAAWVAAGGGCVRSCLGSCSTAVKATVDVGIDVDIPVSALWPPSSLDSIACGSKRRMADASLRMRASSYRVRYRQTAVSERSQHFR